MAAGALTRSAAAGGVVVLCGAPLHTTLPVVEALVRWDPAWFAARELAERVELSLPPTVRMAQLVGPRVSVLKAVELAGLGPEFERLGPLPWAPAWSPPAAGGTKPGGTTRVSEAADDPPRIQLLLRASLADGPALTAALTHLRALRSARKDKVAVSVRVDPTDGFS
jgi:primosomal protein N' (replication factor Y)